MTVCITEGGVSFICGLLMSTFSFLNQVQSTNFDTHLLVK